MAIDSPEDNITISEPAKQLPAVDDDAAAAVTGRGREMGVSVGLGVFTPVTTAVPDPMEWTRIMAVIVAIVEKEVEGNIKNGD